MQSHYPQPASTSSSLPSAVSGSLTDLSSHTAQLVHPGSSFQARLPLYQPGGNLGSWGPSPPPPSASGTGLAMPLYWQGFYGPANGLPQLHQQSLDGSAMFKYQFRGFIAAWRVSARATTEGKLSDSAQIDTISEVFQDCLLCLCRKHGAAPVGDHGSSS